MGTQRQPSTGRARCEELIGLGTWVLAVATGDLTSQPGLRALLGLGPDDPDPTFSDYFRALHPADRGERAARWERLVDDGTEYCLEHRLMLPGGLVKHLRAAACVERDAAGTIVRVHGMTEDVTALRTAALQVERERDRSRAVLASLQEGYLLVQAGTVLEVNDALCGLTRRAATQLVGGPVGAVLPPGVLGEGPDSDVELARADGTAFEAHLTRTVLPHGDKDDPVWVLLVRDTSAERAYERLLVGRTEADPLTGLLNSRAFRDRLRTAVADCGPRRPLSLALLDLDHFKQVNDQHGHAVGDEVLRGVAHRFVSASGESGQLARVGGEEFALLMPGLALAEARKVVGQVLQAVRSQPFEHVGRVTASAGVAQRTGDMTDDALYRLADARLYEAKGLGRDRVR